VPFQQLDRAAHDRNGDRAREAASRDRKHSPLPRQSSEWMSAMRSGDTAQVQAEVEGDRRLRAPFPVPQRDRRLPNGLKGG
jgi:hypothetical protein